MRPDHYHKLSKGLRCKCLKLWREADGSYWCCLPKPAASAMPADMAAHIKRLEGALQSIAKNTCCDNCQEAANLARAALASYIGLAEEMNDVNDAYARGEHVLGVTK